MVDVKVIVMICCAVLVGGSLLAESMLKNGGEYGITVVSEEEFIRDSSDRFIEEFKLKGKNLTTEMYNHEIEGMEVLQSEARLVGANLILLTKENYPPMRSYLVKGEYLFVTRPHHSVLTTASRVSEEKCEEEIEEESKEESDAEFDIEWEKSKRRKRFIKISSIISVIVAVFSVSLTIITINK